MPKSPKRLVADHEQSTRFIEAARELGCDESPDAFEAAVKKVARQKPAGERPAPARRVIKDSRPS